jgi:hypothetical protein
VYLGENKEYNSKKVFIIVNNANKKFNKLYTNNFRGTKLKRNYILGTKTKEVQHPQSQYGLTPNSN